MSRDNCTWNTCIIMYHDIHKMKSWFLNKFKYVNITGLVGFMGNGVLWRSIFIDKSEWGFTGIYNKSNKPWRALNHYSKTSTLIYVRTGFFLIFAVSNLLKSLLTLPLKATLSIFYGQWVLWHAEIVSDKKNKQPSSFHFYFFLRHAKKKGLL